MYWTIYEQGDYGHRMWQTTDKNKVIAWLRRGRGIHELKVVNPKGDVVGRRFKEGRRWNWFLDSDQ